MEGGRSDRSVSSYRSGDQAARVMMSAKPPAERSMVPSSEGAGASSAPRSSGNSPDPITIADAQEDRLLRAHRAGDPRALEQLLLAVQPRLMAICVRMCRDQQDARDLCQDAMVRIIRGLPDFSGRSRLSTWMIRVTMNVCLTDRRRSLLRRTSSLDAPPARGEEGSATIPGHDSAREPTPFERIELGEELRLLSEGLARLDPEPRAILILRDAQGLDYAEIAEVMGIPQGTVKSRLFRARVMLREQIEKGPHQER